MDEILKIYDDTIQLIDDLPLEKRIEIWRGFIRAIAPTAFLLGVNTALTGKDHSDLIQWEANLNEQS